MGPIIPWLLVLALLPRVEDPWPDTIGLDFLLTTSGAGGLLAGLVGAAAGSKRPERAILWGNLFGFLMGAAFYFMALLAQVISGL